MNGHQAPFQAALSESTEFLTAVHPAHLAVRVETRLDALDDFTSRRKVVFVVSGDGGIEFSFAAASLLSHGYLNPRQVRVALLEELAQVMPGLVRAVSPER